MPYFISILAFFIYSTANATCLPENIIKNQYLVVTSADLSTSFSTKTNRSLASISYEKISSSQKKLSLSKTGTQSSSSTYLINASSISDLRTQFPDAKIQPNCKVKFFSGIASGSDPMQSYQDWYFQSLGQSPNQTLTPQREIVVAVSDTGVDLNHTDLAGNLWTNSQELNGLPNVDDDGNGFVDDIYGYDFGDDDSNPTPTFNDNFIDYDHGTHVAGLIAARSYNNLGVSGISLNSVKIMSLKGFKSNAPSTISDLLKTIYYAVDNGAHIINASWGSEKNPEAAEIAAVNYAIQNGVVIVAAAGNDRVPASWFVPAGIKNVVTVGSINSANQLSTFSNYGSSIDFIAPGGDGDERLGDSLLSLGLGSNYLELKGTSMAAPLLAGLLGALMTQDTDLTAFQAVYVLKESGLNYNLSPYLHNDSQNYTKPNFLNALDYLEENQSLPNINPELETIEAYSRDLASSSGGGGCGNSLSSQSVQNNTFESRLPLINILFCLMPILTLLGIKKGL